MAVAWLVILACAPLCQAQKPDDKSETPPAGRGEKEEGEAGRRVPLKVKAGGEQPPVPTGAYKPAVLPEGDGSWAVHVITSGGFAGRGRGDATIISDGNVSCSPPSGRCRDRRPGAELAPLSRLVAAAEPSKWEGSSHGTCNDCYVTMLVLERREGGQVKTYSAYWDDTTAASAPPEAWDIYRAAAALTLDAESAP
jgi:hypothetical protein